VRGAFHPEPGELDAAIPAWRNREPSCCSGSRAATQWSAFQDSSEAQDGLPHPLDRWSQRVIGALASELGAADFYPSGSPSSPLPFQRLARRCEPVHPSPIGLLIHETYGLWHAYRGGLCLRERIALPPCPAARLALRALRGSALPLSLSGAAFQNGSFDLDACVSHVLSAAGTGLPGQRLPRAARLPVGRSSATRRHRRAFT
jgi:hypothetical protein